MNLIKEIEAAAHECADTETLAAFLSPQQAAQLIVGSLWWPRIRAALEAARGMDVRLTFEGQDSIHQRRFREAMKGSA